MGIGDTSPKLVMKGVDALRVASNDGLVYNESSVETGGPTNLKLQWTLNGTGGVLYSLLHH